MSTRETHKLLKKFVEVHFSELLLKEGYVPFKNNPTHWVKFLNEDVLGFIYFGIDHGDFNVHYGTKTLAVFLPIGLPPYRTTIYYINYMNSTERKMREDLGCIPINYLDALTNENSYYQKLEIIKQQLLNYALPGLAKKVPDRPPYEYSDIVKLCECDQESRIELLKDMEKIVSNRRNIKVLLEKAPTLQRCQEQFIWDILDDYTIALAAKNSDMSVLDNYVEQCKEYNIKLLKKAVPLLFDRK